MNDDKYDRILVELAAIKATLASMATTGPARPAASGPVFPNYGRSKGAPIAGATRQDLEYYASGCARSLADESKARFHDKERALLAAINAELERQGFAQHAPPAMDDDGEPSDLPF